MRPWATLGIILTLASASPSSADLVNGSFEYEGHKIVHSAEGMRRDFTVN